MVAKMQPDFISPELTKSRSPRLAR